MEHLLLEKVQLVHAKIQAERENEMLHQMLRYYEEMHLEEDIAIDPGLNTFDDFASPFSDVSLTNTPVLQDGSSGIVHRVPSDGGISGNVPSEAKSHSASVPDLRAVEDLGLSEVSTSVSRQKSSVGDSIESKEQAAAAPSVNDGQGSLDEAC